MCVEIIIIIIIHNIIPNIIHFTTVSKQYKDEGNSLIKMN